VGKGILFLVSLYAMFFFGMYLGDWKNVYMLDTPKNNKPWSWLPNWAASIYNRPQFGGQVWIGIAAWPALWQYNNMPVPSVEVSPFWHNLDKTPPERREDAPRDWRGKTLNELQADGDKTWDLGWVYTVVAGVLNVLVIYDAAAGPAFGKGGTLKEERGARGEERG